MKKVLGVVMTAAVTVALTGCSGFGNGPATQATATVSQADNTGSGDASAKGAIYGIYKVGDRTWSIDEGEATEKVMERHRDEFIYTDAGTNLEKYLEAVNNAVVNQAKGIVACIPNQTMSQAVVDKCRGAGISVVACDSTLQNDAGGKLAPWVSINAYVIDRTNGDWLTAYVEDNNLVGDEQCDLLLLAMDTVSSCISRAEGEYNNFTVNYPNFPAERTFRADYDGATDRGNVAAALVITAHPEIKKWLVTGANEEGTIGAVRTLENAGLGGDVCVTGLGAYMAEDEWNGKGTEGICMEVVACFSSDSVGKGSIEILYKVIGGKEVPLEAAMDAVVVTPKSYREAIGKAAR